MANEVLNTDKLVADALAIIEKLAGEKDALERIKDAAEDAFNEIVEAEEGDNGEEEEEEEEKPA